MAFQKERIYSIDDIYALPDGERAELIDGRLYMMAPPHPASTKNLSIVFPKRSQIISIQNKATVKFTRLPLQCS